MNSEHCRHKIFNGTFIIDGEEKPLSLFKLIKKTSQVNPNKLVSAYKDNVAFVDGPKVDQFYPVNPDRPDFFEVKPLDTVISLKAETHNFPTTVEPSTVPLLVPAVRYATASAVVRQAFPSPVPPFT